MAVNVIVQARMGSKRLPGKVMMEMAGKPMIGHLIDCLEKVTKAEHIIYAIPESDQDSPLFDYLCERRCIVSFGPEEDVAERFRLTLARFPCEAFIRICADSPICNKTDIETQASGWRKTRLYSQSTAMRGTTVQICSTKLFLERLPNFTKEEREHVLLYFVRLTSWLVDTQEDFDRVTQMVCQRA